MKKARETKAAYTLHPERTIALPDSVMDELNEIVQWEGTPIEEAVGRAVANYRKELGHRKIGAEAEMFKRKHPRLRAKYMGKFIAMHNGRVVDHDADAGKLYLRVRKRFGRTPVLIRQVTEEAERVLVFRSPRLEPFK